MDTPPVATVTQVPASARSQGWRTNDGGQRWAWKRTGFCSVHSKASDVFVGQNEEGWIFQCSGWTKDEVKEWRKETTPFFDVEPRVIGQVHYFTNAAPKAGR